MAKEGEPFSGARQFPLHGVYPKLRIVNTSNVVTANVPHAVGAALAAKIRQDSTVILSTFGEGGTSQGEWHESLNFAGIHPDRPEHIKDMSKLFFFIMYHNNIVFGHPFFWEV